MKKPAYVLVTLLLLGAGVEATLRLAGSAGLWLRLRDVRAQAPLDPGAYTILAYGGSYMKGLGACSYPAEIESLLRRDAPDRRWRVINMANISFSNTGDVLKRLPEDFAAFRPQLVLLNVNFRESFLRRSSASFRRRALDAARGLSVVRLARYVIDPDGGEAEAGAGGSPAERLASRARYNAFPDVAAAEKDYLAALALSPTPALRREVAQFLIQNNRLDLAENVLNVALGSPEEPAARLMLATVARARGDAAGMERQVAETASLVPGAPGDMAIADWAQTSGDYERAGSLLRRAAATGDWEAARRLARFESDRGRWSEAEAVLAAVRPDRRLPEWYSTQAYLAANRGDRAAHERWLKDAVAKFDAPRDRLTLGDLYFDERRLDEAEALYRAVLSGPAAGLGWWKLANVNAARGNRVEEAACLEKAVDLLPDTPEVKARLCRTYRDAGDARKARESARRFGISEDAYLSDENDWTGAPGTDDSGGAILAQCRANIGELDRRCRAAGVKLVLDDAGLSTAGLIGAARDATARYGIPFADVTKAVAEFPPSERERMKGAGVHYSSYGYRRAAELVYARLRPEIFNPPKNK